MTLRLLFLSALLIAPAALRGAADLPALWAERVKSIVAVENVTETETERLPSISMGTVIDTNGTIILPSAAIDPHTPTWQLKDFKVYLPGDSTGTPAEYLGQDAFTGWHFVRASKAILSQLVPVTAFAAKGPAPVPALAEFVWGLGLRPKDEDFAPYLMQSHVALIQSLPQRTAIAQQEVAGPGLAVFNRDGVLVGLAAASFGNSFLQFRRDGSPPRPVVLINVEESAAFTLAGEILPYLGRLPKSVSGRPLAWLGTYGLEPMDRDVAKFLKLEAQSGAVVSEVLEGSPAEKAGLKNHDIILALDGRPLPQLKPDRVVVTFIEREVDRRAPGDTLALTVLRGAERVELKAVLAEEPKLLREADRKYFERLGFAAREFVYGDAIDRHVKTTAATGVVAHFVKPSSPAATAGLQQEDWIKEIDGVELTTFAAMTNKLAEIEHDVARAEFVLLVSRGGETAVLRVKLK